MHMSVGWENRFGTNGRPDPTSFWDSFEGLSDTFRKASLLDCADKKLDVSVNAHYNIMVPSMLIDVNVSFLYAGLVFSIAP